MKALIKFKDRRPLSLTSSRMRRNSDVRWRQRANHFHLNQVHRGSTRSGIAPLHTDITHPIRSRLVTQLQHVFSLGYPERMGVVVGISNRGLHVNGVQLTTSHQRWGRREKRLGLPMQKGRASLAVSFMSRTRHPKETHTCSCFSKRYILTGESSNIRRLTRLLPLRR